MLLDEKVLVSWNNANKKHYVDLGYTFTKAKDKFYVSPCDLPLSSSVRVKVKCEYCGKIYEASYKNYIKTSKNGKDCCSGCRSKKASETMKERYGVNYYTQTDEFKKQVKQTCFDRYGVSNPSQVKEIQDKKKATNIEKFGSAWYVESKDFSTLCEERYGVDNPMKAIEVQEKAAKALLANGQVPTSKEEQEFINILIDMYGAQNCTPSFPEGRFVLDCLLEIDGMKIDAEYDGWYWHKTRQSYDRARDEVLKQKGYKVLRVVSNGRMPTKDRIAECVDYLSEDTHNFSKIKIDI